ncbi:Isoleucine--tRNA ligase [Galdieria sulphuraria]|nr:Isoleucine--tRNA ligase [Galdieria sulphuraria]
MFWTDESLLMTSNFCYVLFPVGRQFPTVSGCRCTNNRWKLRKWTVQVRKVFRSHRNVLLCTLQTERESDRDFWKQFYKNSINLPKTRFEQRANAAVKELEIQKFWEDHLIYEKVLEANQHKTFVLHDGPPYANGTLHVGHALNKILKDIICRYHLLRGFYACFIPGWDCHGLPIELKVWQSIPKENHDKVSVIELRRRAAEFARNTIEEQKSSFKRFGIWGFWSRPYLTMSPEYEAAQIQVFGELFLRGFIYRARKPVHWSPSSKTALAEAELEYSEDHISTAIYVSFRIAHVNSLLGDLPISSNSLELVIWTTTPWTLPANEAVAVNPHMTYSLIEVARLNRFLIVAKDCLKRVREKLKLEWQDCRQVLEWTGESLVGIKYYHPIIKDKICRVVRGGNYITSESGTGLVHTAPGHGEEDFVVGKRENLPISCPVDENGMFTKEAGEVLFGHSVLGQGNKLVLELVENMNLLLAKECYRHKYPYDWRTKEPTIYRTTEQWFASLENFRKEVLDSIDQVTWIPESKKNLIRCMVMERSDWCISRQRAWGVPIPVFYDVSNEKGSDAWFYMSEEELLPAKHKNRHLVKGMDTMDVWFDSGCSWAALESKGYLKIPADLYLEGRAPYLKAITHGFVLDEKGVKMSKSVGNVIDPQVVVNGGNNQKKDPAYGADVLRLWVASVDYRNEVLIGPQIIRQVADIYRKIRNTLRFMVGNLYDFRKDVNAIPLAELPQLDIYMLTVFNKFKKSVESAYERYDFTSIYQAIQRLCITELSNFYLDISKDRLYVSLPDDYRRRSCQTVLHMILEDLVRIVAPLIPHTAEDLWQCFEFRRDACLSVFQSGWLSNEKVPLGHYPDTFWENVRLLRDDVNKCLEKAREEQLIGSSLEGRVGIYFNSKDDEKHISFCHHLRQLSNSSNQVDQLEYLFLVSQVEFMESKESLYRVYSYARDSVHSQLDCYSIGVSKALGHKCFRCWNFSTSVQQNEKHPELCHRCISVVDRLLSK